jgi:nucleotide-binding universal stress UspA family protein
MAKAIKFLVCVDQREESKAPLRLACMKAQSRGGAVDMLHVIVPANFQTLGVVADRMREEQKKEAEQLLARLANEAATAYGVAPRALLREGEIGEEIVHAASEDPDLIVVVIGVAEQNNTRGSLASWLAGQLGSKLMTPLLMVPGNLTDEQLRNLI